MDRRRRRVRTAVSAAPPRLASVDALRGLTVAAMLLVNNPGDWSHVYPPLLHADWHGCTPTDLIFPLFLFVVGVSIALGLVPRAEAGADRGMLQRGVVVRALKIIAIGLLLHALAMWLLDRPVFRVMGVLQRIGLCFLVAATLALHVTPRLQWMLVAAILMGYWALLAAGGSYAPGLNLADRFDTAVLGPLQYRYDPVTGLGQEPEGLLSTLPAIATTLLGVRAGTWLRRGDLRRMGMAAAGWLLLGGLWSLWLPLNKPLWTSSYVLWTAGWALLALLALHTLVDRRGWPALGRSFGVNAITAYAGAAALIYVLLATGAWGAIYRGVFAGWMTPLAGPYLPSLAMALCYVLLWWCVVRWMDRRGWRLAV
jgi:predicted acyltransferase